MTAEMPRVSWRNVKRPKVASFISQFMASVISAPIFHFQALGYLKAQPA